MWVDGLPEEQRAEAYAALKKRGKVKIAEAEHFRQLQEHPLSGGDPSLDRRGVIPGAKLEEVWAVPLTDYDTAFRVLRTGSRTIQTRIARG